MTKPSLPGVEHRFVRRVTLDNGLRVLLDPRTVTPVVDIAVHYHVGFRSDPVEGPGFAHLLEHLMFSGSPRVGPTGHHRAVQASGGYANATTHQDYTEYVQVVPPRALERVLFLEADRMRGPLLTRRSLRTEIDVIKEEIRLNVTNKPYGGFPWLVLPRVLYRHHPNAHDGYGTFDALERATLAEVDDFFAAHYTPGNALLTLSGSFDPDVALGLVERHFGDIPARPSAPAPDLREPAPVTDRYGRHHDPLAPRPALAIGYRLPDPKTERASYLAHTLLVRVLTWRLRERLTDAFGPGTAVHARSGLFGPFQAHTPDTLMLTVTHRPQISAEAVLDAVDRELIAVAHGAVEGDELAVIAAHAATATYRVQDTALARARRAGSFEVLHGLAEYVHELPRLLCGVTPAAVVEASRALRRPGRAILTLEHGGP